MRAMSLIVTRLPTGGVSIEVVLFMVISIHPSELGLYSEGNVNSGWLNFRPV